MLEVDFGINPETLKSNYLDLNEAVHAEKVYTNWFDENIFRTDKNDKRD